MLPTRHPNSRPLVSCHNYVPIIAAALFWALGAAALAQDVTPVADPEPLIEAVAEQPTDERMAQRIRNIFEQIETLKNVNVVVREGVVMLSGSVSNEAQAQRALDLAIRLEGVVTVDDGIDRTLDVQGNVMPLLDQAKTDLSRLARALPLILLALLVFLVIAYAGHLLAKWSAMWQRIAPNPFLAELLAQAIRVVSIITGLVVALNLIGATALMGTILGGAGVLGLAIGFAVRDTMENYISSIMLSLRQPFRANDHVVIGEHEGKVVRLTSRATVLMTLDGNHLRIPNSTVFKAVILNYSRNPERRFSFELGVDAEDDPVAAMKTGLDAISKLDFVLTDPKPNAVISAVGDSNIVINFMGWVDQTHTDFGKARSLSIRAAKNVLEEKGFTLPEPIYRLRFDQSLLQQVVSGRQTGGGTVQPTVAQEPAPDKAATTVVGKGDDIMDVTPDTTIEDKVNDERALESESDLLDKDRPVE